MNSYRIAHYKNSRGEAVVERFIEAQDKITKAKILRFVDMLIVYGPNLGMPYARNLTKGLFELRIHGKNEVRIIYVAQTAPNTITLLHAFRKRSQKLPERELQIARQRQKELTEL